MLVCDQSVSKAVYKRQQEANKGKEEEEEEKEEEKEEEEKMEEEEEEEKPKESKESKKAKASKDSDNSDDSDDSKDADNAKDTNNAESKPHYTARVLGDADEGRTLFIRTPVSPFFRAENLPLEATQRDVFAFFQRFGALVYAKLCVDKLTGLPRGTGFVKFESPAVAASLLRRFDPYSKPDRSKPDRSKPEGTGQGPEDSAMLTLLGRPLQISLAVAPKQLKQ